MSDLPDTVLIVNHGASRLSVIIDMSSAAGDAVTGVSIESGDKHAIVMQPGYKLIIEAKDA